jgi:hypothetical protein
MINNMSISKNFETFLAFYSTLSNIRIIFQPNQQITFFREQLLFTVRCMHPQRKCASNY